MRKISQPKSTAIIVSILLGCSTFLLSSCDNKPNEPTERVWSCTVTSTSPDYASAIGCRADFTTLSSEPMNKSIPGATSVKTIIDQLDPSGKPVLYFMNCKLYEIHHSFASKFLSGGERSLPFVPGLSQFNGTEYTSPNRRFLLGEITYFEGPKIWAYQLASNDNASAAMITKAFEQITANAFFGDSLYFHPVSQAQTEAVEDLPASIRIITTEELYAGIDYQPLNCATSMGRLVFVKASELETKYVSFRDITLLDVVPNDISVTSGIITQAFQTPLAHINVLSQNRKTPNMALKGAWTDSTLRALEGKWVELTVDLMNYTIKEVTAAEADAWWDKHKPSKVGIATMDTTVKELCDVEKVLDIKGLGLGKALDKAIPAFGGKASHFSAFPHMDTSKVPYPAAFVIPVFYYWQFMEQNGLNKFVDSLLADTAFKNNPAVRDHSLKVLRDSILEAPFDPAFEVALFAKLNTKFKAGTQVRFRSSTNAEDLDGFTGAGLYISEGGNMDRPNSLRNAVRTVWSSVWFFRAFEERSYRQIEHKSVGMAVLVHHSFSTEEATGVAITANIYDQSGMDPGFYINVQYGDNSVVLPDSNVSTDEFIYKFNLTDQPIVFIARSNILPVGRTTVLTARQTYDLGVALEEIHEFFQPLYGSDPSKKYAMDTEFKFDQPDDDPNGAPVLSMKQCRPYYAQ
jgi:hypothetical protein